MAGLKKINKNKKVKKEIIIVGICLIVNLIISIAISYAVYQKTDEVLFINAKVGQFETSSSDIELAMMLDGNDIDIPPSKGYYNVIVECNNADGEWDTEKWRAIITNISSNRVKCNVNFETLETRPLSIVELGDYISMTPTSTSYTIPTSLTGYSSNQTINPSELNLWRVIRKNADGTIDMVSEYVSSKDVTFYGRTGWMNLVGSLNTIATQYTNEKYVSKTRHMGYSNQTLNCASLSVCPSDTAYTTDVNLVKAALDTIIAKSGGNAAPYWVPSRNYLVPYYLCTIITLNGDVQNDQQWLHFNGSDGAKSFRIRPILTLNPNIDIISGDGKSVDTAYQFE